MRGRDKEMREGSEKCTVEKKKGEGGTEREKR